MAKSEFILQGFTTTTHERVFLRLFDIPDIQRVLLSVAFVTEAGVGKIEARLIPHSARVTVFAGVRNGSTSYQGLVRLHGLVGELYVVDTRSPSVTFHPKLYLVRGMSRARLIIGSANLTSGGLSGNIEAGMLIDLDLANAEDKSLVDSIENPFDASVTDHPDHIVKINGRIDLDKMLATCRLVDERELRGMDNPNNHGETTEIVAESDDIPPFKLKVSSSQAGMVKAPNRRAWEAISQADSPTSIEPEASSNGVPIKIEAERESSVTHYVKWRAGEGRRQRARRARDEAKKLRKKWYHTGDKCRYGHYSDRLVSNGKCRECNRQDSERTNRLGLYR